MEEADVRAHAVRLKVAYDLGVGAQMENLPCSPIHVEPKYRVSAGDSDCLIESCSGSVSKQAYLQLYRIVQILFPTLQKWRAEVLNGMMNIDDRGEYRENGSVRMRSDANAIILSSSASNASIRVFPNFLHGCLEAIPAQQCLNTDQKEYLRTIRSLGEAVSLVNGEPGSTQEATLTPLGSPSKRMFQSPPKAPLSQPRGMSGIYAAINQINEGNSSGIREGIAYLQIVCRESECAETAAKAGVLTVLVKASAFMMATTAFGPTEQLSMLTLTASMILDSQKEEPQKSIASKSLVQAFIDIHQRPCANPALLLQFMIAMNQRADVKAEAIKHNLASHLSSIYIQKSPLLEPLAHALISGNSENSGRNDANMLHNNKNGSVNNDISPRETDGSRVPKLSLGSIKKCGEDLIQSPTGLTRATRREKKTSTWTYEDHTSKSVSNFTDEQNSQYQMSYLAQALGESLVAQDLPAIIGHKRRDEELGNLKQLDDADLQKGTYLESL